MDIFLGIDGTGPANNEDYRGSFKNSHVRSLFGGWHTAHAQYLRGPSLLGAETAGLAQSGARWLFEKIAEQARGGHSPRIFLSGYSRGGAAAVEVANKLAARGQSVHCLMLFDAVDRSPLSNSDVIPKNVRLAYHALRDPKAASREIFGNCATRAAPGVAFTAKTFFCTHGGMGGTPWTQAAEHGRIRETDEDQRHSLREVTGAIGSVLAGPLFAPAGQKIGRAVADVVVETNVTLEQDRAGAQQVWSWMSHNLTAARSPAMAGSDLPLAAAGKRFLV